MLPISDDNSQNRAIPVVTYGLIAINVLFFLVELAGGDAFIEQWAFVPSAQAAAVDGGDGSASVTVSAKEKAVLDRLAARTASRPNGNPVTGADLGAGPGAGASTGEKARSNQRQS